MRRALLRTPGRERLLFVDEVVEVTQANLSDWQYPALSEAEQDVYRAVEERDLSISTVAENRDVEETTVRTILHRARRKRGEQPRV